MNADLEFLEKICWQYSLGRLDDQPFPLKGGFLHKMYSLSTSEGRYAVKLLNPYIMQRETAMENYRTAEKLEGMLEKTDIPILPALWFEGRKMQCIEGQFFYLYEWYDGKALKPEEINAKHCHTIGKLLAWIHGLDRQEAMYERSEIHIECSEEEIAMGISEVKETVAHLIYYHNARDEIMDCLKEFS